ncbi:MAG: hypothetical protein K0R25_547 [Rickettsiaceae bacterium]|jgi:hypothetical protein|nr:hypothetical protein [Rickettsiaceae bacterium]
MFGRQILRIFVSSLMLISVSTSCAFSNLKTVSLTIGTDPVGASIYVDGVYYGKTATEINVVPDKNYSVRLEKEGYQTINFELESRFSMRKGRDGENTTCKMDLLGSVLIFPIMGWKSVYCRDFTQRLYNFDLAVVERREPVGMDPIPPHLIERNYYPASQAQPLVKDDQSAQDPVFTPDPVDATEKKNIDAEVEQIPFSPPDNSNQQEQLKGDNENLGGQSFNRKIKDDYNGWQ